MYFISSVPLISWQPDLLSWFTIVNNQTKYKKWAYTENRTLTYSIIRYTMRGYFAAQGDKPSSSCVWWFLNRFLSDSVPKSWPVLVNDADLHVAACLRTEGKMTKRENRQAERERANLVGLTRVTERKRERWWTSCGQRWVTNKCKKCRQCQ